MKDEGPDFSAMLVDQIPRLRKYARALTRDPTRADDLVQDTLLRAVRKQHRWEPGTNLRAWLFTLMHNQHVNTIRQNTRDADEIAYAGDEVMSAVSDHRSDPASILRISELLQTMNKLPMDQRRAVVLCGYYGLDYEAAALHEKVHVGTIRSRVSRGRDELRKLYEGTTSEGWLLELIERWGRAPSRRIVEHEEENV